MAIIQCYLFDNYIILLSNNSLNNSFKSLIYEKKQQQECNLLYLS